MVGPYSFVSVVVRRRVTVEPWRLLHTGPASSVEIGTARHACVTLKERGRGTDARSQPAKADCWTEFTQVRALPKTRAIHRGTFVHERGPHVFPRRRNRAELG